MTTHTMTYENGYYTLRNDRSETPLLVCRLPKTVVGTLQEMKQLPVSDIRFDMMSDERNALGL